VGIFKHYSTQHEAKKVQRLTNLKTNGGQYKVSSKDVNQIHGGYKDYKGHQPSQDDNYDLLESINISHGHGRNNPSANALTAGISSQDIIILRVPSLSA